MLSILQAVKAVADTTGAIPVAPTGPVAACVLYGGAIAVVVNVLKQLPWVAANPKVVALIGSDIVTGLSLIPPHVVPGMSQAQTVTLASVVTCVLTQFGAAVATHEVVLVPTIAAMNAGATPPQPPATP
jgi:hypothetical protein